MGLFTVDRHRKASANTFMFFKNIYASAVFSAFFGFETEKGLIRICNGRSGLQ